MILASVATVEPIEYGLKYNSFSKAIDKEHVYVGGLYIMSPISSFLTFPATLVNIDFTDYPGAKATPVLVKDSDGQEMTLSFSLQYKLKREGLTDLYNEFQ